MYNLEDLNAEAYALRRLVERKEQLQEAIMTRLAQVEVELKRLDKPPEFDRYERSIDKLVTSLTTLDAEVIDLQEQVTVNANDLFDLQGTVNEIHRH